jgi:hypothetical protein
VAATVLVTTDNAQLRHDGTAPTYPLMGHPRRALPRTRPCGTSQGERPVRCRCGAWWANHTTGTHLTRHSAAGPAAQRRGRVAVGGECRRLRGSARR